MGLCFGGSSKEDWFGAPTSLLPKERVRGAARRRASTIAKSEAFCVQALPSGFQAFVEL